MAGKIIRKKRRGFKHLRNEDVPEAEPDPQRLQGRKGRGVPPPGIGIRTGGQEAPHPRGGMPCHPGRRIQRHFRLREDPLHLLQERPPVRDKAGRPAPQKGLEDTGETEDVHGQEVQRHAGIRASGGRQPAEGIRALGRRPRRRAEGRHQRRIPDPRRTQDPVPRQDTGPRQEGIGHPFRPPCLQVLPSVVREEVPQRDVRQRLGVRAVEGEGEPAGDQDLLRASLPFGRQREQRELQRPDTEIREEGHGHREDRPGRDREDQPEHQCQAERNPRLGQRGVFLREHALEGRSPKGGYVPPKEVIPFLFRFTNQLFLSSNKKLLRPVDQRSF